MVRCADTFSQRAKTQVYQKRKVDGEANGRYANRKRFRGDIELNEGCYLRVNIDRYMLATRDAQLKNAVKSRYGLRARDVMGALLVASREGIDSDTEGTTFTSRESLFLSMHRSSDARAQEPSLLPRFARICQTVFVRPKNRAKHP